MFIKDASGAILNTDDAHYRAIVAARNEAKRAKEVEEKLKKFDDVENELNEIKLLLKNLIGNDNVKTSR